MKYYTIYDGIMRIKEINDIALSNRNNIEKIRNTYNSLPVYDSIEECIKSLGNYSKITILPDNSKIIPLYVNYNIPVLKKVQFPVFERLAEQ
jgi:hypothetical protein